MTQRAHVDHEGNPVEVPWRYYTSARAARMLGVDSTYLDGMANNGVPAVKVATDKGNSLYLFNADAIDALVKVMSR